MTIFYPLPYLTEHDTQLAYQQGTMMTIAYFAFMPRTIIFKQSKAPGRAPTSAHALKTAPLKGWTYPNVVAVAAIQFAGDWLVAYLMGDDNGEFWKAPPTHGKWAKLRPAGWHPRNAAVEEEKDKTD